MALYLRVSGEPLMPPPDADFSFRIVFEKGQGDPRRIFDAASELIDGFVPVEVWLCVAPRAATPMYSKTAADALPLVYVAKLTVTEVAALEPFAAVDQISTRVKLSVRLTAFCRL